MNCACGGDRPPNSRLATTALGRSRPRSRGSTAGRTRPEAPLAHRLGAMAPISPDIVCFKVTPDELTLQVLPDGRLADRTALMSGYTRQGRRGLVKRRRPCPVRPASRPSGAAQSSASTEVMRFGSMASGPAGNERPESRRRRRDQARAGGLTHWPGGGPRHRFLPRPQRPARDPARDLTSEAAPLAPRFDGSRRHRRRTA